MLLLSVVVSGDAGLCDSQGGNKPLRRAPPYPPMSSQKMLEGVEDKTLRKFDRDFRWQIGFTSPDNIDSHITARRLVAIYVK